MGVLSLLVQDARRVSAGLALRQCRLAACAMLAQQGGGRKEKVTGMAPAVRGRLQGKRSETRGMELGLEG